MSKPRLMRLPLQAAMALFALMLPFVAARGPGVYTARAPLLTLRPRVSPAAPARAPAAATPAPILAALPPAYYQDGATVYAVNADGSNPVAVATLPGGDTFQPQLLPDGRLLYSTGSGFAVIDRFGRRYILRTPDLNPGESVWSVAASPNASTLAWQLFAPLQLNGYSTNAGISRIVLTGRFGGRGSTVLKAQAGAHGAVPVLLGWRPASLYGLGGPTLLLQDLFTRVDAGVGVLPNAARGLLEYDPAIGDLVDDYLPPLGADDIPRERDFAVSGDGVWAIYGDSTTFTPSGEGPLATAIYALDLNTNTVIHLDNAGHYPSKQTVVTITKRKVGKRVRIHKVTTTLRLYEFFGHHAYVAPGNGRVLYTLLTVSYPPGALVPQVRRSVVVATLDGRTRQVVARDAQAAGWLDGHVAVIQRAAGLYAINVVFGGSIELAAGRATRFLGVR